jgi:hypothetical protein
MEIKPKNNNSYYQTNVGRCLDSIEFAMDEVATSKQFLAMTDPSNGDLSKAISELLEATSAVCCMSLQINTDNDKAIPRFYRSGRIVYHYDTDHINLMLSEITRVLQSLNTKRQFWLNAPILEGDDHGKA